MPPDQPLNLIRIFDFYLALMFLISLVRRWDVYVNAIRILVAVRGRWPKLIERLGEHKSVLLNWSFFRPAMLALFLMIVQLIASRLLWPQAVLTGDELRQGLVARSASSSCRWSRCSLVDLYFIFRVGRFDHGETVKYLDQAESWLGWKGPLVRLLTLGIVNPRRIVDEEVKKSLTEMQTTLTTSLWWVILQTVLRLAFGLTLWTLWAFHG